MSNTFATHDPLNVVTIDYLLQTKSRPFESGLVILDSHDTVETALKRLAGYKILSAPVRFGQNQWRMFDVIDAAVAVITTPEAMNITVGQLSNSSGTDNFITIDASQTILDGMETLVKYRCHRVVVIKDDKPFDLLSQMDIVRWLVRNYDQIPSSLKTMIMDRLKSMDIFTTTLTEPLVDAFRRMMANKVSGLAVVDERGSIVAHLGASDLRGMLPERFTNLLKHTVQHFLHETKHYLLKPPVTIRPNDTFEHAIKLMQQHHIHRVFVIGENNLPAGVFSTTDVLNYLMAAFKSDYVNRTY